MYAYVACMKACDQQVWEINTFKYLRTSGLVYVFEKFEANQFNLEYNIHVLQEINMIGKQKFCNAWT